MGHEHSVIDSDRRFIIDPIKRTVKSEHNQKIMLMQYDHNSERFTFQCPKTVEGHDMSECSKIQIHCGYGGTAVLGNSSFHKPIDAIDYNMDKVLVNEQFPDIICIEHGYNDGTLVSSGTYSSEEFKTAYNELIDRLKVKYAGVPIVCIIPFKQSLKSEIIECVKNRTYCYVIETENWNISYTDKAHPDVYGSENASKNLARKLLSIFGKQFFM